MQDSPTTNQQQTSTNAVFHTLRRDLSIAYRHSGEVFQPLIFFVIMVTLFPLAVSPDPNLLQTIAPGIIWIAALLSSLLVLDNMFRTDFENGTLEQIMGSPHSVILILLTRVFAHWLISALPLVCISVLLGLMLNLHPNAYWAMVLGLLLGTPAMSLLGSIGAALTVGLRRRSILTTLIVMPLFVPILIFGTSAIQAAGQHQLWHAQLYFLGAILVLCLTLAPFALITALRISMD